MWHNTPCGQCPADVKIWKICCRSKIKVDVVEETYPEHSENEEFVIDSNSDNQEKQ